MQLCRHTLASVQAMICMAIYFKTVGAVAAAHKIISRAVPTAIRAGLHEAPLPLSLPDTVAESRQRTYDSRAVLEILLSSCFGIPRLSKTTVSASLNRLVVLQDYSVDAPRVVVASQAHAILVEHLGLFAESTHFSQDGQVLFRALRADTSDHLRSGCLESEILAASGRL